MLIIIRYCLEALLVELNVTQSVLHVITTTVSEPEVKKMRYNM